MKNDSVFVNQPQKRYPSEVGDFVDTDDGCKYVVHKKSAISSDFLLLQPTFPDCLKRLVFLDSTQLENLPEDLMPERKR